MTTVGSLVNLIADRSKDAVRPEVGTGVTVIHWTDREAATVVEVSRTGHRIVVQSDTAKRTDHNGPSESQTYEFTPDPHGSRMTATRRKDGTYRLAGGASRVVIGVRSAYEDPTF